MSDCKRRSPPTCFVRTGDYEVYEAKKQIVIIGNTNEKRKTPTVSPVQTSDRREIGSGGKEEFRSEVGGLSMRYRHKGDSSLASPLFIQPIFITIKM